MCTGYISAQMHDILDDIPLLLYIIWHFIKFSLPAYRFKFPFHAYIFTIPLSMIYSDLKILFFAMADKC